MREGAENVHTKIQAKAESVLRQQLDSSKGKLIVFTLSNFPGENDKY